MQLVGERKELTNKNFCLVSVPELAQSLSVCMSSSELKVLRIYQDLIVIKQSPFNRLCIHVMCIHEYTHKHTRGKTFLIKIVTRTRKFSQDLG